MTALAPWNPGDQVLIWSVNVLLQAAMLSAIGLAVASLLRRSPAMRHWVLCLSLLLVLCSPAIALLMQWSGRSFLSVSLMEGGLSTGREMTAAESHEQTQPPESESLLSPPEEFASAADGARGWISGVRDPFIEEVSDPQHDRQVQPDAALQAAKAAVPDQATSTEGMNVVPGTSRRAATRITKALRLAMPPLLSVWLVGAALFLVRLAVGWCRLAAVLRGARPNANLLLAESFHQAARALQLRRTPELVLSSWMSAPVSAGLFRPRVVLPERLVDRVTGEQLRDIFIHELAHIERRDQVVVLLQNLAAAILWLHPLVKALNRELALAREEVCDNYVLTATDAPAYSRTLLTLAELVQTHPPLPTAVGLFTSRWKLERRVAGILDESRSRMIRLSLQGEAFIGTLALMMATVAAMGTITLALGQSGTTSSIKSSTRAQGANATESAVVVEKGANVSSAPIKAKLKPETAIFVMEDRQQQSSDGSDEWHAEQFVDTRVSGHVLGPDGKPKPGATIYVVSTQLHGFLRPGRETVLKQGKADALGGFDFTVALPPRDSRIDSHPDQARYEKVIAIVDGCGPAVLNAIRLRKGDQLNLELPPADIPIEGQILDLEGQPVAGARLMVAVITPPRGGIEQQLAGLRERAQDKPSEMTLSMIEEEGFLASKLDGSMNEAIYGSRLDSPSIALPPTVTTDDQGRFRITGVGRDQVLAIQLAGPNIVTSWLSVVSRDIEPIKKAIFIGGRTDVTYGAKLIYTAEPSQPIEGDVTDADSGEPIDGVRVEAEHYDAGYASAVTDDDGRYRLEGLPKKKGHILRIVPPADEPYFSHRIGVTEMAQGLNPSTVNFTLKRGKWIEGRVISLATGEPVSGHVWYYPLLENEHAMEFDSFNANRFSEPNMLDHAQTQADGSFRVRATPGKGVLMAKAAESHFRVGVGSEAIPADGRGFLKVYNLLHPKWGHAFQLVDVPDRDEPLNMDLQVDPGTTLTAHLQDEAGEPLTGVRVWGRLPNSYFIDKPLETDSVEIRGVDPERPRAVFFYQPERNLAAFLLADQERSAKHTVTLWPCATLKGQLTDEDGKPLAGIILGIKPVALADRQSEYPIAKTDNEGRFETPRFIPGAEFDLYLPYPYRQKIGETLELQPGQMHDLGTIESASPANR